MYVCFIFYLDFLTHASWTLTNRQHVMHVSLATLEDAVKSERPNSDIYFFYRFLNSFYSEELKSKLLLYRCAPGYQGNPLQPNGKCVSSSSEYSIITLHSL